MAEKYGSPVFSGLPTPRQRRMIAFMIISGMLAITTALHYTEPGRGIYTKIMDPSSRSAPGSGSGWGTFDDQSPSSPGSGSSGDNEQSPPRGGWDDLLGGQPR